MKTNRKADQMFFIPQSQRGKFIKLLKNHVYHLFIPMLLVIDYIGYFFTIFDYPPPPPEATCFIVAFKFPHQCS